MGRSFRNVRQAQAVRAFCRAGGVQRQGKGSHQLVKMPNGRNLAIPSGVLKVGLLRRLIKLADLTEEEFAQHL